MKNLQTIKRIAATLMTVALIFTSLSFSAFAADDTTVKIYGTDDGVIVTLYKVIKQDANGNWINIYKVTDSENNEVDAIADPAKPSSAEILALAQRSDLEDEIVLNAADDWVAKTTSEAAHWAKNLVDSDNTYGVANDKGAGMYLVLIKNSADNVDDQDYVRVYNPMIVSIAPDNDTGDLAAGSVSPETDSFETEAEGNVAYVKSSVPTFDKYIIRKANDNVVDGNKTDADKLNTDVTGTTNVGNANTTNENKYGDTDTRGSDATDPAVGDKVWFEIATTIPAYADNYVNPVFKIHDTLSTGLTINNTPSDGKPNGDLEVYVGGAKVEPGANTWSIDYESEDGETFVITFAPAYLNGANQKNVVVRYSATVGQDCKYNFNPETNTAKITYTHKPGEEEDSTTESEEKKTYHYTFSINDKINGEGSQDLREVVKVGASEDGSFVFKETTKETEYWVEDIEGAVFKLYKADTSAAPDDKPFDNWVAADNNVIRTATSDKDGRLKGLDRLDCGDYVLVEDSVPSPYAKKKTPIPVRIEAELKDNGQLLSYKITVGGVVAGNYKATYDADNNITSIEALADDDTTSLGTYKAASASTATQAGVETLYKISKNEGETDAEYAARIDEYLKTFDDVHPEAADIRNTKIGTLPSTGGMGTVAFTVGGIVIMLAALFLLFGGKKKNNN
jgi:fimbrial isopeptide formation D2 family protein/LPXTG-motif cell wall-anchored protein